MSLVRSQKPTLLRQKGNIIHDRVCQLKKISYLNPLAQDDFAFPSWEHPEIFGNSQPVNIEYCSGNGAWIASKAISQPNINWVAVEMKFGRTRKIWSKIKKSNLQNLFIVNGEAEHATQSYFSHNSVNEIFINFPDPWPKRHHAKNRLIKPSFVQAMASLLKENGSVVFVTDDEAYSDWTLKIFQESPYFTSAFPHPHYVTEWPDYGNSYFEDLWREKGYTIRYHKFTKVAHPISSEKSRIVTIPLDATQKSTLNWEEAITLAERAVKEHSRILWDLKLGLFDQLLSPLSNQQQFLALSLAIQHFSEIIWSKFSEHSVGAILFRGPLNLSHLMTKEHSSGLQAWIQDRFETIEAFCEATHIEADAFDKLTPCLLSACTEGNTILAYFYRDAALDYLKQLAGQLPYGVEPLIELDVPNHLTPIEKHIYLNKECYGPIRLLNASTETKNCSWGICLPPVTTYSPESYRWLDQAIEKLNQQEIDYVAIPEEALITHLEGLDHLIVSPLTLSMQGKRQIQGFCAAGGTIHYTDHHDFFAHI
jgi:tRNA (guanine-N7-)-methyltransferase